VTGKVEFGLIRSMGFRRFYIVVLSAGTFWPYFKAKRTRKNPTFSEDVLIIMSQVIGQGQQLTTSQFPLFMNGSRPLSFVVILIFSGSGTRRKLLQLLLLQSLFSIFLNILELCISEQVIYFSLHR